MDHMFSCCSWRHPRSWLVRLVLFLAFSFGAAAFGAPVTIYQAFNQKFTDILPQLQSLQSQGFTHILISPPQKSLDRDDWWARYQPVDFRVFDGPLGNRLDLQRLVNEAQGKGISVLVDAVLNHMADDPYIC